MGDETETRRLGTDPESSHSGKGDEASGHRGRSRAGDRSFFWPVILISAGILLLLAQAGVIEEIRWWTLLQLWPALLILAGLDILFSRRAPLVGSVLALGLVLVVVLAMSTGLPERWSGEQLPAIVRVLPTGGEVKHDRLVAPLADAESARVEIAPGRWRSTVSALEGLGDLLVADVDYTGRMRFDISGERDRRVLIDEVGGGFGFPIVGGVGEGPSWDVAINPEVPLDLVVDLGSGGATLDLERLELTQMRLDVGSGSVHPVLPGGEYALRYTGGSGQASIEIAEGAQAAIVLGMGSGDVDVSLGEAADAELRLVDGGSGHLTVQVAKGSAMHVDVRDSGSGRVRVPSEFRRIEGREGEDEGIWETADYGSAEHKVSLRVDDLGSGNVTVEYLP